MYTFNWIFLIIFEIFSGLYYFNRGNIKKIKDEINEDYNGLLCKFVITGTGKKIGESVSIDNDIIIIKSGKKFLGVPLKHIEDKEKILLVKGLIDFDKAYKMGEKWRKKSFSTI